MQKWDSNDDDYGEDCEYETDRSHNSEWERLQRLWSPKKIAFSIRYSSIQNHFLYDFFRRALETQVPPKLELQMFDDFVTNLENNFGYVDNNRAAESMMRRGRTAVGAILKVAEYYPHCLHYGVRYRSGQNSFKKVLAVLQEHPEMVTGTWTVVRTVAPYMKNCRGARYPYRTMFTDAGMAARVKLFLPDD